MSESGLEHHRLSVPNTDAGGAARSSSLARRMFSGRLALSDLWLVAVPAACLAVGSRIQIYPSDFWWHLRTGQMILAARAIPTVDTFTFTRFGTPWTNQSWLAEALFYLLDRAGGLPLLIFSYALLITAGYVFLELACLRRAGGHSLPAVLGVAAGMALGQVTWGLRPQVFSFLCFGLLVWIIAEHERGRTRIAWGLPVLFLLWVNLHGGFVFGLGLLSIYAAWQVVRDLAAARRLAPATRTLLAAGGLSIVAMGLNPQGLRGLAAYVFGFLQSQATQELNLEFMPLNLRAPAGQIFVAATLAFLVLLYRHRAKLPAYQVLAILAFGAFTLWYIRVIPWYGMVLAPVLAQLLAAERGFSGSSTEPGKRTAVLNYLVAGFLVLLSASSLPWLRPYLAVSPDERSYIAPHANPQQSAGMLCGLGADTRAFSDIAYSSYLEWFCPTLPTFMDTRIELYPLAMWQDYLRVSNGQFGWEEILAKYRLNAILANKQTQAVLVAAARASGRWQMVYEDGDSALFAATADPR